MSRIIRKVRDKKAYKRDGKNWRAKAVADRKAERGSQLGRENEARVERLLAKKLEASEIISFKRHLPNSPEDLAGDDFQVSKEIDGEIITVSFGVTISQRKHKEHSMKHPDKTSLLIPLEMRDERIWYRICQILKEAK